MPKRTAPKNTAPKNTTRRRPVNAARLPELLRNQTAALRRFAAAAGKEWKSELRAAWMRGGTRIVEQATYAVLHGLRNTHGSEWLDAFELPEAEQIGLPVFKTRGPGEGFKTRGPGEGWK